VTEGTRTPDLQGHNLGDVTGEKRCRPRERESDLRSALWVADADPRASSTHDEGVVARLLPAIAVWPSRLLRLGIGDKT
jgi:hypothetical protein